MLRARVPKSFADDEIFGNIGTSRYLNQDGSTRCTTGSLCAGSRLQILRLL